MKSKKKNTSQLRRVLTISIVLCFVFFLLVFVYQYNQYKRIEDRLTAAYSTSYTQSSATYRLFSTFSEADNLFRLYTVDYSEETYQAYALKLDTLKSSIDSIANMPLENNPMVDTGNDLIISRSYAQEFANLKRDIDQLVFYATDSLVELSSAPRTNSNRRIIQENADSLVNKILQDTISLATTQDTIVREKEGLLQRIFNAKDDTVVTTSNYEVLTNKQVDVVHKNIEHFIEANEKIYQRNLNGLQMTMHRMRNKERELINSNYKLLHSLKNGLDRLKHLEMEGIRRTEARDFGLYKNNFDQYVVQLIVAVIIMLLMIIFIVYYYYKTSSFERKLYLEKEYASKIAEEKTNILANVSHEVRTPLNSLKGIIDILKKNNHVPAVDEEIMQAIDKDISVINGTLNDILSLSKLEAESFEIKYEFFSPSELLDETIALHEYSAKSKKLTYNNENTIDKNVIIRSNSFRIKQIVSNIISNAIKYTNEGEITIDARMEKADGAHRLHIEVRDTGIGISNDKKDQVFRKYYVADTDNRLGGFGLGLYISKLLNEHIGGNISFTSKDGEGSIFTFELPVQDKHIKHVSPENYTVQNVPEDLEIIIVDDSRIGLFFIQQLFRSKKNIHFFDSAAQAMQYIREHRVDIVVTDLVMPSMSGWELLKTSNPPPHISTSAYWWLQRNQCYWKKYQTNGTILMELSPNPFRKAMSSGQFLSNASVSRSYKSTG